MVMLEQVFGAVHLSPQAVCEPLSDDHERLARAASPGRGRAAPSVQVIPTIAMPLLMASGVVSSAWWRCGLASSRARQCPCWLAAAPGEQVSGRLGKMPQLTVPENAGLVGESRRGAGPLAPNLDPCLNQRLVHPGGDAQVGDLPVPGGVGLVLAIAKGQACALSQQSSPPGGSLLQLGDRSGFLVGCQLPAVSGACRMSRGLRDEETIRSEDAHVL